VQDQYFFSPRHEFHISSHQCLYSDSKFCFNIIFYVFKILLLFDRVIFFILLFEFKHIEFFKSSFLQTLFEFICVSSLTPKLIRFFAFIPL
jgi:hypothetical protein